jgi:hypothetical protein
MGDEIGEAGEGDAAVTAACGLFLVKAACPTSEMRMSMDITISFDLLILLSPNARHTF